MPNGPIPHLRTLGQHVVGPRLWQARDVDALRVQTVVLLLMLVVLGRRGGGAPEPSASRRLRFAWAALLRTMCHSAVQDSTKRDRRGDSLLSLALTAINAARTTRF